MSIVNVYLILNLYLKYNFVVVAISSGLVVVAYHNCSIMFGCHYSLDWNTGLRYFPFLDKVHVVLFLERNVHFTTQQV